MKESTAASSKNRILQQIQSSEQKPVQNSQHLACATDTCGSAAKLPYLSVKPQEVDVHLYKKNLEHILQEYLDLQKDSLQFKSKVLQDFSAMQIHSLSDSNLVLINFLLFVQYDGAVSSALKFANNRIQVDVESLKKELEKVSLVDVGQIRWITTTAKLIFESQFFYENWYLSQFPLEIFVQKKYPELQILDALSAEAKTLLETQNRFIENYPLLEDGADSTLAVLKKAISKQPLSPDEKKEFILSRLTLSIYRDILPHGSWRSHFTKSPFIINQIIQDSLAKYQKSLKYSNDKTKMQKDFQTVSFECSYHLLNKIAASPTLQQNNRFRNRIQNLKSESLKIINSNYKSPEVLQALDQVKLILPPTKDETVTGQIRSFLHEIKSTKKMIERIKKFNFNNQDDKETVLLMLVGSSISSTISTDENVFIDVKEYCEEQSPETISDAAYTNYQVVNVGWRSVLYPEYGLGIAAHEIGHVLSTADAAQGSQSQFTKVKACLSQNQNGSTNFVEEDFADLFAAQIIKQQPQAHSNYSCLLLSQESGEFSELELTSSHPEAKHSSSFYRLIAIGSHTHKLSPSCRAVKLNSDKGHALKNCWGL